MTRLNQVLGLVCLVALAAYPILVFWGLQHWSPRHVSIAASLVLALSAWRRVRAVRAAQLAPSDPGRDAAGTRALSGPAALAWIIPLATALGLCAVSFALNRETSLLFMPVLISSGLLILFGWTLIKPPTMVEQFALLLAGSLSGEERRYCRRVTWVWTVFFVINIAAAAGTALFAPRQVWALYNGLVAYILIGLIFTVELVYRHWRFRRYVGLPTDMLLKKLFPPRCSETHERRP